MYPAPVTNSAWEQRARNQVLCAILHVDTTTIAWAFGLRQLHIPGPVIGLAGMPYDHARNTACQRALDLGVEWLFFLDSDVTAPADTLPRLMAHGLPLISGVYCRRSPPHGIPVMLKRGGNGAPQWVQHLPPRGLMEVDLVGAGCLLIHRTVLEKLAANPLAPGKPWFAWRVDQQGILPAGECLSEDFAFNQHCQRLGFKVHVDCSIRCKHIGLAEADYGVYQPCTAN